MGHRASGWVVAQDRVDLPGVVGVDRNGGDWVVGEVSSVTSGLGQSAWCASA